MVPILGEAIGRLASVLAAAAADAGATPATGSGTSGGGATDSPFGGMLPLLAILGVFFYLFILRPQSKEKRQRQQILDSMKKGDRIVTIGGMHGKVVEGDEAHKTVAVEVAPKTVVKFSRAAVQTVEPRGSDRGEGKDKNDTEESK